ncbi:C4-dicarboxylate ABC transporter [Azospirillum sp. TSH100]|uniref:TRAP transporter large permease n=1 Tax=Azospirillum sp. TSH100 TaxID=652764 RepID=UPI000D6182D5|nr:TRAP transporter large permease [Azospirillum sp. TSH100]PWC80303.1 C4-dicarboxylate ABC transporter [Azospirillum sp. TSH100]QCG91949.1 TRAP transporter large permease [Azospirillum sp. TSH100]
MITTMLFGSFLFMLLLGVPIAVALGLAGTAAIGFAHLGVISVPTSVYTGIAKYPLLTIPMFVLAGTIFDRSGVAQKLVRFATAVIGQGKGALAVIAVVVAMMMGGIAGSGPAIAAAVCGVMAPSMIRAGYPRPYIAGVIAAAAATDILIPPSVALIIYSVLVPAAPVTAMFAAGIIPGTLAGLALIIPTLWLARRYNLGGNMANEPRPPFWSSLWDASLGMFAKVLILGGLRLGIFTPTEAAVIAVAYGLLLGMVVYRTIKVRDLYSMMVEAAEISAIILTVIALASVFGWAMSTLSIIDPIANAIVNLGIGEYGVMFLLMIMLIVIGTFLDGVSTFIILLPLLIPIAMTYHWDLVWFGVLLTLKIAIGQFTPPMAVNLMVTCRIAGCTIESTIPWVLWLILTMFLTLAAVVVWPDLALWMPRHMGF